KVDEPVEHRLILPVRVRLLESLHRFEVMLNGHMHRRAFAVRLVRGLDAQSPAFQGVLLPADSFLNIGNGAAGGLPLSYATLKPHRNHNRTALPGKALDCP